MIHIKEIGTKLAIMEIDDVLMSSIGVVCDVLMSHTSIYMIIFIRGKNYEKDFVRFHCNWIFLVM